ncbi:MAG: NUDIX hydrolase [Thermodesulfobacteriota bacterium]|jgi:8-oxo-dGTP pyrophosphatase MutT (NUDIX family)
MPRHWPVTETVVEGDYRIFRLRRDRAVSPRTGASHDFYVLETRDWVNVIPVTEAGEVVMVRQYRHGVRAVTLEIPGGILDGPGEDPAAAARRELLEETGYAPREILPLGAVQAQPALQDNLCHTYLALGCEKVADPEPDAGEDLRVLRFPLDEVPARIASGEIRHGLVLAAFYWYELWRRNARTGAGREPR